MSPQLHFQSSLQLTSGGLGNTVENGPSAQAPETHTKDADEALSSGFDLAQHCWLAATSAVNHQIKDLYVTFKIKKT